MRLHNITDFKGGWFIGNFDPSILKTEQFEVCYKYHPKGDIWPAHYHKLGTEYNLLVRGKMRMHGYDIEAGTIFIMEPMEVADPEFLEDCEVLIIKAPSVPGDKYEVNSTSR